MDDIDMVLIMPGPESPLEDVEEIGTRLMASGALIPSYVPPDAGMLSIAALSFAQDVEQTETQLLPDRNIASRMARLARDGAQQPLTGPNAVAADLMAFAQAMNIQIEPSIAFHELAHGEGNEVALEELSWFRAADHGQAQAWIDLAQGRINRLPIATPKPVVGLDLAYPLRRWRLNYVVALKIAELELTVMSPLERALALFQWMVDDYFMAGPAAIFATMYFAPFAKKRRLIKQLRSADRERALAGIKNAAWDITHLSNFVAPGERSETEKMFFIFATADRGLAEIAPILMIDAEENHASELARGLSAWWPATDALRVAESLSGHIHSIRGRDAPGPRFPSNDPVQALTDAGEARVRAWRASISET